MNFEQFIDQVKNEVRLQIGSDYSVSVNCVMKINRELQGLSILHNGSDFSPSIYLEDFFEEYKRGKSIYDIATEIITISKQRKQNMASIMNNIQNFDWVRPRLRVKLINYQKNERLLKSIPYEKFLDLAIIPYILISKENGNLMTTRVTYSLMEQWSISEETLLKLAKDNTILMSPVIVEEMTDFILHVMLKELDEANIKGDVKERDNLLKAVLNKETSGREMFILTNESNMDGAFAAFQVKELADLADRIGVEKLYLLPSSIHELIAVPTIGIEPHMLRKMVKEINCTQVPEEDFLSDSIYQFSRIFKQISVAVSND